MGKKTKSMEEVLEELTLKEKLSAFFDIYLDPDSAFQFEKEEDFDQMVIDAHDLTRALLDSKVGKGTQEVKLIETGIALGKEQFGKVFPLLPIPFLINLVVSILSKMQHEVLEKKNLPPEKGNIPFAIIYIGVLDALHENRYKPHEGETDDTKE